MISVLYVDDDPTHRDIAKLYLEKDREFSVETVVSARDALTKENLAGYDAIVSDYQMPAIDGIEFLQSLRAAGNNVPFILFTGRGREEVVIRAFN
ncbi:MAG: response regulator [Methanomicrobiales archaeon]|nr:response regulator [Methanomicrobiales archaeon]